MIIKSIRLKNFRKFKDTLIEFPDGVTGVVGLNGAGKSTIFEAVAWVLYGAVAARTSTEQIKRESADDKDPCRVELDFIFGEDKYRIVREMSGKSLSVSATATFNGQQIATGAEVVSNFIQKKLGLDFKSFYTSIFAKQKELNALSTMNPSERRPLILRMLGINALDEVIVEIRSDVKNKKILIEKQQQDLVDEKGNYKIEKFKNEKRELQNKKKNMTENLERLNKNILAVEKRLNLINKNSIEKKKEYEKLNKIKLQLDEKKSAFEKKKSLCEYIEKFKTKVEKRQDIIKKEKLKLKNFEKTNEEIKNVEKRQSENSIKFQSIMKKLEQKKTIINQINSEIHNLKTKKITIEKIGSSAKCPTCDRVLGKQYDELLRNYENQIKKHYESIKLSQDESKKINVEYDKLVKEKEALQKKKNFLYTKSVEKEKILTLINNFSKELDDELQELNSKKKDFSKISSVEFDEKEYKELMNKIEIQYNEYQSYINEYKVTRNKIEKLKIESERKGGEKKLINQEIKNLDNKIEEHNKLILKIKFENKNLQLLKILSELMNLFRTYLISQIRPTLSLYASELFNQLTDGKYSEIELDENYNLIIYDNGNPYNIERFSGGEEDLANLCIRLAISEVITAKAGSIFNLIILDEIFGSQDNIRKQNIIKSLSKFSAKFRQIFLITHVSDIKNFMENTISVIEDENGISKIKIE